MPLKALLSALALCLLAGPAQALELLSRQDWGANQPVLSMREHRPAQLTIHHSGVLSPPVVDLIKKMRGLQAYSQSAAMQADGKSKPIWADVPYHFVIGPDGRVAEGRPIGFAGDTNTEYDPAGHVLVTLLGNFEEQKPTEPQIQALIELLAQLSLTYELDPQSISGHRDQAETACPGQYLQSLLPDIRLAVTDALKAQQPY